MEERRKKNLFTWSHAYKVCTGRRNFGMEISKAVAEATGTDPLLWRDMTRAHTRFQFLPMIEAAGFGADRPKVAVPKKRGPKPKNVITKQQPHKRGGKK